MKKSMTLLLALLMTFALALSAAAEPQKVLELDFSDSSCVKNDDKSSISKGTLEVADGVMKMSGWTPGTTTAANYVKSAGILPEANANMGSLTLEFEFTPLDVSWICSGIVIGDKNNGSEQDAVIVGFNGNDFKLDTRGQIQLNMGGILTTLGEFNTGELIPDMTYVVWIYKDNTAGTVDLYFYEKGGKVPEKPTLSVQSDTIKTVTGNISFTAYAGRYTVDNLAVYDGEAPRPTAPPTTKPPAKTTTAQTEATTNAPAGTTAPTGAASSNGAAGANGTATPTGTTATDNAPQNGGNTTLIVILCVAGVVVIGAAVAIILIYRSSRKKAGENIQDK